jgi:hypothetical protein
MHAIPQVRLRLPIKLCRAKKRRKGSVGRIRDLPSLRRMFQTHDELLDFHLVLLEVAGIITLQCLSCKRRRQPYMT